MEPWSAKMATNNPEILGAAQPESDPSSGRFAYEGLERIFHEKARLGILTSLVAHPKGLVFSDLKDLCALTDGNLSRHLQVLKEEGLLEIWKGYHQNRPQTLCRLTEAGRERFLEYINVLEHVVADALAAARPVDARAPHAKPAEGWSHA
jgi:DNA-binding MarR family transcriptional regulator